MKRFAYFMFTFSFIFFALGYAYENFHEPSEISIDGTTYLLSKIKLTQNESQKKCEDIGGTLANPKTDLLEKRIRRYLRSLVVTNSKVTGSIENLWIGLQIFSNGRGSWSDGTTFDNEKDFNYWAQDEPKTRGAECVQLWVKENLTWDDMFCFQRNTFLCEQSIRNLRSDIGLRMISTRITQLSKLPTTEGTLSEAMSRFEDALQVDQTTLVDNEEFMYNMRVNVDKMTKKYDVVNKNNIYIEHELVEMKIETVNTGTSLKYGDDNLSLKTSSISLPKSLFEMLEMNSKTRTNETVSEFGVTSILYRKPESMFMEKNYVLSNTSTEALKSDNTLETNETLFDSPKGTFGDDPLMKYQPHLIGNVISADVINVTIRNLTEPVQIKNTISKNPYIKNWWQASNIKPVFNFACSYWNESQKSWNQDGCWLKEVEDHMNLTTVTCECDHLTNFAILMSVDLVYAPLYLSYVTIIGCVLSACGLIMTTITNLIFKQLRTKTPQQILIHVCLNMAMLNIVFLIGIDRTNDPTSCFAIAAILHYFILTTWFWMFFEAVFLFLFLVMSNPNQGDFMKKHIVVIAVVTSYLVPAFIVGITSGYLDQDYLSNKYCWLSFLAIRYFILIPVGCLLAINFILFVIVTYSITCQPRILRNNANLGKITRSLRRAVCMTFVLGLPWVFGFFMLLSQKPSVKEAMAVIFTIFNSFQGVLIFVFFCARQDHVKTAWVKLFCKDEKSRMKKQDTNTGKPKNQRTLEYNLNSAQTPNSVTETNAKTETKFFRSHWAH